MKPKAFGRQSFENPSLTVRGPERHRKNSSFLEWISIIISVRDMKYQWKEGTEVVRRDSTA
jgi:hypothetical protein